MVKVTQADTDMADYLECELGLLMENEREVLLSALARHRIAGIKAGLEAAAKVAASMGTNYDSAAGERFAAAIRNIDPESVGE